MSDNNQDVLTIFTRRLDLKGATQFFKQIDEAYKDGYELLLNDKMLDAPRLGGYPRVKLVKVGSQKTPVEIPVEEPAGVVTESQEDVSLEDLTKKADLLEYANKQDIEIPENLKQPAAIKKYIQEQTSAE